MHVKKTEKEIPTYVDNFWILGQLFNCKVIVFVELDMSKSAIGWKFKWLQEVMDIVLWLWNFVYFFAYDKQTQTETSKIGSLRKSKIRQTENSKWLQVY